MNEHAETVVGLPDAGKRSPSIGSVATAIVVGVVAAFILSWIYGPLEHYSFLPILNIVLAYGLGWIIGTVCTRVLRAKKINRVAPAALVGLVSGLAGLWFAWLAYIWVISGYDFQAYTEFMFSPEYLVQLITYLAEDPLWSLGNSSGSAPAILYYLVWLVEAVCIVGLSVSRCLEFVRENSVCEGCGEWVRPTGDVARFYVPEDEVASVSDRIAAGDITAVLPLTRMADDDDQPRWLEVAGYACETCQERDSMVNVSLVTIKLDKNKKPRAVRKALTRFVPVDVEGERLLFEPPAAVAAQPLPAETDVQVQL